MKAVAEKSANNKPNRDTSTLWEKVTSDAKDEVLKLRNSFEAQLQERNLQISSTKKELDKVKSSADRFNAALADMTRQRDEKIREIGKIQKTVAEQNEKLGELENEVAALSKDLQERDEAIARYESSYCGLINLSCKITSKRLRNAGLQIGSMFERIPPETENKLSLPPERQPENAMISF